MALVLDRISTLSVWIRVNASSRATGVSIQSGAAAAPPAIAEKMANKTNRAVKCLGVIADGIITVHPGSVTGAGCGATDARVRNNDLGGRVADFVLIGPHSLG